MRIREPWMTNFCIRFLYEVFFELTLCIMINIAYVDASQTSTQIATWVFCLLFGLVAIVALICITSLFWGFGAPPEVSDSYEKNSVWSRLTWGRRALNEATVKRLFPVQDKAADFKPKDCVKAKDMIIVDHSGEKQKADERSEYGAESSSDVGKKEGLEYENYLGDLGNNSKTDQKISEKIVTVDSYDPNNQSKCF